MEQNGKPRSKLIFDKEHTLGWVQWLTAVIPAIQEAEIKRIMV
jgi:hypothetical protein